MHMNTKHVVYSIVIKDVKRSFTFYKDGLGITDAKMENGFITLELPGMLLFLAEEKSFSKYASIAQTDPYFPQKSVEGFFSCSIGSREEIDEILQRVKNAGGEIFAPQIKDHSNEGNILEHSKTLMAICGS